MCTHTERLFCVRACAILYKKTQDRAQSPRFALDWPCLGSKSPMSWEAVQALGDPGKLVPHPPPHTHAHTQIGPFAYVEIDW